MDSQDYLDQISAASRPKKPGNSGLMAILTSKYTKWGAIAVGLLIIIMIFGSMLGGRTTAEERCAMLKLRLDGTTEVISEYQGYVKSSSLRSLSASLRGILVNTSSQLTTYMVAVYDFSEENLKETILEEAVLNRDGLINELFEAKINGFMDRTYAHKMALEIYTIMSDEASIINSSSEAELNSLLNTSYDSLNNLYSQFNDFSETK